MSSLERCPLFIVSFIERSHCKGFIVSTLSIDYLPERYSPQKRQLIQPGILLTDNQVLIRDGYVEVDQSSSIETSYHPIVHQPSLRAMVINDEINQIMFLFRAIL